MASVSNVQKNPYAFQQHTVFWVGPSQICDKTQDKMTVAMANAATIL